MGVMKRPSSSSRSKQSARKRARPRKRPPARSPVRSPARSSARPSAHAGAARKGGSSAKTNGATGRKAARKPRRRGHHGRARAPSVWRYAGEASVFLFSIAFSLAGLAVYIGRDLPSTEHLWRDDGGARASFVASDGTPLRQRGEMHGAPVRLADLPAHVPQAVLAIEDRNFYHHAGINPLSVFRALIVNARAGDVVQGGSTITQQLAKNLFLSSDRTYRRKLQEIFLAFWLEDQFTKDEILTLYLNRVYFGGGAWGIDAASHRYFDKPASRLTLAEAAILAGLLKAPGSYAPHLRPDDAGRRARLVIEAMGEAGYLDADDIAAAIAAPVHLAQREFSGAPYFVDFAAREAARFLARAPTDIAVRTTLSPALQSAMEAGIERGLKAGRLPPDAEVAAVLLSADGKVRAMVGGRNYQRSQFNRAVQARRQAGSAFKPFVFAAALKAGYEARDRVDDTPLAVGRWSPDNYNSRFFGEVTLTTALAKSLNAATVRLQESVGRAAVRDMAAAMGLDAPLSEGPALALGVDAVSPLMLARAYAPLANGGYRVSIQAIDRIETIDGSTYYTAPGGFDGEALNARHVNALNRMLEETVRTGTGRRAAIEGVRVAGKTGTTQDHRDGWFVGHARGFVLAVWVGRDDNQPMIAAGGVSDVTGNVTPDVTSDVTSDVTGGGAPAILWREIMTGALTAQKPVIARAD